MNSETLETILEALDEAEIGLVIEGGPTAAIVTKVLNRVNAMAAEEAEALRTERDRALAEAREKSRECERLQAELQRTVDTSAAGRKLTLRSMAANREKSLEIGRREATIAKALARCRGALEYSVGPREDELPEAIRDIAEILGGDL